MAEEGREAEASAPTVLARRPHAQPHAHSPHSPHSQNQRWMRAAGTSTDRSLEDRN